MYRITINKEREGGYFFRDVVRNCGMGGASKIQICLCECCVFTGVEFQYYQYHQYSITSTTSTDITLNMQSSIVTVLIALENT